MPQPTSNGLKIWLRPEELAAAYGDGDDIPAWLSYGGSESGVYNVPPDALPKFNAAGGAGLGSVRFMTGDPLKLLPGFDCPDGLSVYGVGMLHYVSPHNPEISWVAGVSVGASKCNTSRTAFKWTNGVLGATAAQPIPTDTVIGAAFRWGPGKETVRFAVDGTQIGDPVELSAAFQARQLGWLTGTGDAPGQEVSEVLIYDRELSDDEDADVWAYLKDKYGF